MPARGRRPRTAASGALALLAALCALGGCARVPALTAGTQHSSPSASPATSSAAAASPTDASGQLAPLTGASQGHRAAGRPAVAIPVTGAHPAGLGSADLVFEEMGAPLRYLAVFQSKEAAPVGPVTATLPSDGQLLSVMHPLTGYNGGSAPFIRVLDRAKGIVDEGYAQHSSLYTPTSQELTTSTSDFYRATGRDGSPPQLFSYRHPGSGSTLATTGISRTSSVRVTMPGAPTQVWDFDARAGRWTLTSGGPTVHMANLIIQMVSYKQVYVSRRYGITTPSPQVLGTGKATVFSGDKSGGTSASGSWAKRGAGSVTAYLDSGGYPMIFASGPTWTVLAPPGTRIGS
jgi:hypothetical protein